MVFDFKNDPQTSGFKYSNLTEEDLKTVTEAEQKLSSRHNTHQVLIAYDGSGGSGQSGIRS